MVVDDDLAVVVKPPVVEPTLQFIGVRQRVTTNGAAGSAGQRSGSIAEQGGGDVFRLEKLETAPLMGHPQRRQNGCFGTVADAFIEILWRDEDAHVCDCIAFLPGGAPGVMLGCALRA